MLILTKFPSSAAAEFVAFVAIFDSARDENFVNETFLSALLRNLPCFSVCILSVLS